MENLFGMHASKSSLYLFLIWILLVLPDIGFTDHFMRVSLLGTGSPRMHPEKSGPAVLVEAGGSFLIFDAGRGVVLRLTQLNIPITEINSVFLTHLHADHIFALDDLWLTGWIYQRPIPLSIYGPEGTEAFVQGLRQAFSYDVSIRNRYSGLDKDLAQLIVHEITPGMVYSKNGVRVTAFTVSHAPVHPAYGYKVDFGNRSIVISGDTTYSENLVEHSRGVDLLIHEIFAAHPDWVEKNPRLQKIERYHTNPAQLVQVLHEAGPKLTVLTHMILVGIRENDLIQNLRSEYSGRIILGKDLMRLNVGSEIEVLPFNGSYK